MSDKSGQDHIDATNFDLIASMSQYAQYFAGGAPYNGFVLANNLHRAIVKQGHKIVLSGVGGDECVSSHAPLKVCIPQLIREQGYKTAWHELYCHYQVSGHIIPNKIKRLVQLIKLAHPMLSFMMERSTDIGFQLRTYLKNQPCLFPSKSNSSLSEHEYNLLQGTSSHHLRMRIEYSSVLAKSMGFSYVYPLLYPKLVEFCYQLPLEQKRFNGTNRCLIRKYLAQFFSPELYGKHSKSGSVTPATLAKTQQQYDDGIYNNAFHDLPFQTERNHIRKRVRKNEKYPFMQDIPAYMFNAYWKKIFATVQSY